MSGRALAALKAPLRLLAPALLLAAAAGCNSADRAPAEQVARVVWSGAEAAHGGFSGIEVGPEGRSFTAISDRGRIVTGTLLRDAGGTLTGVRSGPLRPLRGAPDATPDAEGLAIASDGTLFVSAEGRHRILHYDGAGGPARPTRPAPAFAGLERNRGFEALAIDADGTLWTLPEHGGDTIPLYRRDADGWQQVGTIPSANGFVPVGADFGPDGALYLLERKFFGPLGFASQVRRVTLDGPPRVRTLLTTGPGTHDNLEGLAVWRDPSGALRLTMVSDDNFLFLQTTEIVEYRLRD
ncbi:esterase-like activity of phytase family protein [Tranquillimonas rosea]|uniref:esterase-like activity of phytase family protein n=1 Tax=Tranquillimonas rosea TaxID=641238 RepID=UPI0015A62904|nr:esterase-like activity of phytase family protein [Tranquillimonas rosea]